MKNDPEPSSKWGETSLNYRFARAAHRAGLVLRLTEDQPIVSRDALADDHVTVFKFMNGTSAVIWPDGHINVRNPSKGTYMEDLDMNTAILFLLTSPATE